MPKTVIIVDHDLGFAFWLGHALDQAGYNALPAINVVSAVNLLTELGGAVDLVVINAGVAEADSFIVNLRRVQPHSKVIAVVDDPDSLPVGVPSADLAEHKPIVVDETARADWVATVRMVLSPRAVPFQF